MTSERQNKYDVQSLLFPLHDTLRPIQGVTPMPTGTPGPRPVSATVFPVFRNYTSEENHFAPSGWMGDIDAIHFNDCARLTEDWNDRVIEIQYSPSAKDQNGWAGIYWQEPENNWGTSPSGYALSSFSQLRFLAKSDKMGTQAKFFVGGVYTGTYPSSLEKPIYPLEANENGFVGLSTQWQEYHIDLHDANLSNIIDGFGWLSEREAISNPVTIYLDEIVYEQQPLGFPVATPTPITGKAPTDLVILSRGQLKNGYDLGIDSSEHVTAWASVIGDAIQFSYPSGQSWGVAFVTVGKPATIDRRQTKDFSPYDTLEIEMRGKLGGEWFFVGIKDRLDADDGSETKQQLQLTTDWKAYRFALSEFITANLSEMYIPVEIVFDRRMTGSSVSYDLTGHAYVEPLFEYPGPETVYLRSIRFIAKQP